MFASEVRRVSHCTKALDNDQALRSRATQRMNGDLLTCENPFCASVARCVRSATCGKAGIISIEGKCFAYSEIVRLGRELSIFVVRLDGVRRFKSRRFSTHPPLSNSVLLTRLRAPEARHVICLSDQVRYSPVVSHVLTTRPFTSFRAPQLLMLSQVF